MKPYEFSELYELASGLAIADWDHPSLCEPWSVRDVIAHVFAWERVLAPPSKMSWPIHAAMYGALRARTRLSIDRLNRRLLNRGSTNQRDLIEGLLAARSVRARLFDSLSPGAQLVEVIVHQQDIRRALGPTHTRAVPSARLAAALGGIQRLPGVHARRRARNVRFVALDVEWSLGHGPVVEGPGEAILMALAGRPSALRDVDGEGVPILAARGSHS